MNKIILTAFVFLALSGAYVLTVETAQVETAVTEEVKLQVETKKRYIPTQAQSTWLSSLEWCESKGIPTAINKMDRDGTPSYGALQFKPSTLKYYALKYELLTMEYLDTDEKVMAKVMDRDIQRAIVTEMIGDKSTRWNQQFPDCTKRFVGLPPRY
jgi:hypothetical protein